VGRWASRPRDERGTLPLKGEVLHHHADPTIHSTLRVAESCHLHYTVKSTSEVYERLRPRRSEAPQAGNVKRSPATENRMN
jgi:hypothetical protein